MKSKKPSKAEIERLTNPKTDQDKLDQLAISQPHGTAYNPGRKLAHYKMTTLGGLAKQPRIPGMPIVERNYDLCGRCYGRGCFDCEQEGVIPKSGTFESGPMEEDRIQ